jgi:integrase
MARRVRATKLDTREARLRLPVAKKPIFAKIAPRVGLGYRRNKTSGTWVVRVADGKGGNWIKAIGTADDFQDADGNSVMDFWQAQDRARVVGRAGDGDDGKLATVAKALDRYEADLKTRCGDAGNVARVRIHLSDALANQAVTLLTSRDLRKWRDSLAKQMAASSVNRVGSAFKAALNLLADHDEGIVNRQAWEMGLATIPNAEESRNVILTEPEIRAIIDEAYRENAEFGLLVEVAAVTGARVSQLARLEVQDAQTDRADPRLMMPTSRKGRGQRKITRRPVPIPTGLVARLRSVTADKPDNASLLVKSSGAPWKRSDQTRPFQRSAMNAGFDPREVTLYALRHSNIVRQLLAGVPIRIVAVNHDTSVLMIEKTYSRHIGDHADTLTRPALLDTSVPPGGTADRSNVVTIDVARR